MEFLTPSDIGNRALQHCGAEMMDTAQGFTEVSKNARQVSFCYPKLRRAELQRNNWTFSTRRVILRANDANTMLISPAMWVAGTTYFVGSIVSNENNNLWISRYPNNLGNEPETSNTWEPYFGPRSVSLYDTRTTYFSGELVYTTPGDGTYRVYLSLENANADNPATASAWSATTTYRKNQVVTYLTIPYMSLVDLNLGQTPSAAPALWNAGTTYGAAATAAGSDGLIYTSLAGGNLGNDPVLDLGVHWSTAGIPSPWTTVFVGGTGSAKWLQIGGAEVPSGVALVTPNLIYPAGSGPSTQSDTRNIYWLPNGYLKTAPQDPKAGAVSYLGAPGNLTYNDWLIENGLLISAEFGPIALRFVADITDVSRMSDMFCEGLAARMAQEVCEILTQSTAKLGAITQAYKTVISEARTANAIEAGSDQPPLDDFIACRA